jgi:predicted alpha/beta hydrolase
LKFTSFRHTLVVYLLLRVDGEIIFFLIRVLMIGILQLITAVFREWQRWLTLHAY